MVAGAGDEVDCVASVAATSMGDPASESAATMFAGALVGDDGNGAAFVGAGIASDGDGDDDDGEDGNIGVAMIMHTWKEEGSDNARRSQE